MISLGLAPLPVLHLGSLPVLGVYLGEQQIYAANAIVFNGRPILFSGTFITYNFSENDAVLFNGLPILFNGRNLTYNH